MSGGRYSVVAAREVPRREPEASAKEAIIKLLDTETLVNEAIDVATLIFDAGLARVPRPADVAAFVRAQVYDPNYAA